MMPQPYPWQSEQWSSVQQRLQQERLPHALLLHGIEGMGKQQFAQALAHSLLCEQRPESGLACGECRGCKLIAAGNHPDLSEISPEEPGKNITIDMIRRLASKLSISSQYGGYKVVVLSPAEQMNIASANALLKTLEEPTDNTILILVCSHIDRLLPTIRSRCQAVLFAEPEPKAALTWLMQHGSLDQQQAQLLFALSGQAPLRAKSLAKSEILSQRAELLAMLQKMARGELTPVQVAEQGLKFGLADVIHWLSSWCMDMIRLNFISQPSRIDSPDLLSELQPLSQQIDLQRLYGYFDKLIEASRLARTQANPQLLLEGVLIGWVRLCAKGRS